MNESETATKVIGVTGHRTLNLQDTARVISAIRTLVANPTVDEIWVGGALGADTYALRSALTHRTGKRPKLVVVVPNRVGHQPEGARTWILQADQVIELGNAITEADGFRAYKARNEFICDHASVLLAFWDGKRRSGTGSCVTYAEKIGLPVKRVPLGSP